VGGRMGVPSLKAMHVVVASNGCIAVPYRSQLGA